MEYVESFRLFGTDVKQIPCIPGKGAPTETTEGAVGCMYMDTDTGALYKCTAVDDGLYIWQTSEGGGGGVANAVLYTKQSLTEKQKAQARENIGVEAYINQQLGVIENGSY